MRLRYFFGQHLGVVDFTDQLAYDIGKHRFSNRRLHGSGVLCGLNAERLPFPQGNPPDSPTTLLRVSKGAAIDGSGREVLVPVDQCIDINGWLARHRERAEIQAWNADNAAVVWVGLRYRECPSHPAPAPRDPCGCDASGCEYSRVLEGFELALLTTSDLADQREHNFPASDELLAALTGESSLTIASPTAIRDRLTTLVADNCPSGCCGGWLILARVALVLGDQPPLQVVDISSVEIAIAERRSLLSTATLQFLIETLLHLPESQAALASGPRIAGPVQFSAMGDDSGQLFMDIALAQAGSPPSTVPLMENTLDSKFVIVSRFDPGSRTWQVMETTTTYQPARLSIVIGSGLTEGSYRLVIAAPPETPIVDEQLQPLQPEHYRSLFRLSLGDDGFLHLDATTARE